MWKYSSSAVVLAVACTLGILAGHGWSGAGGSRSPALSAAVAADAAGKPAGARRFGAVIGLKPEKLDEYVRLHANAWPEVLSTIRKCHIRNYSIYLGKLDDGKLYLFSYFEYAGDDFEADMKRMAADPKTQEWWTLTDPCQVPPKHRKPGEHWMAIREVFHTD